MPHTPRFRTGATKNVIDIFELATARAVGSGLMSAHVENLSSGGGVGVHFCKPELLEKG